MILSLSLSLSFHDVLLPYIYIVALVLGLLFLCLFRTGPDCACVSELSPLKTSLTVQCCICYSGGYSK